MLALRALWFSQLGLLPNFTLARYKLTTIRPPHLASERGKGTLIMATESKTHSGLFFCLGSSGEEGGLDEVNYLEKLLSTLRKKKWDKESETAMVC